MNLNKSIRIKRKGEGSNKFEQDLRLLFRIHSLSLCIPKISSIKSNRQRMKALCMFLTKIRLKWFRMIDRIRGKSNKINSDLKI